MTDRLVYENLEDVFEDIFSTIQLTITDDRDIMESIINNYSLVADTLERKRLPVKIRVLAQVTFDKPEDPEQTLTVWVSSPQIEVLTMSHLQEAYKTTLIQRFQESAEKAQLEGSGWSVGLVERLELHVSKYNPIVGKSYLPLPKEVSDKKAVLNIKNTDDKCFMWCVLAKLHHKDSSVKPERVSHYREYVTDLNFTDIAFPVSLDSIDKFESQNKPVTVNVYEWHPVEKLLPLKISPNSPSFTDLTNHVDLLLITDSESKHKHYTLIRNMSRLLGYTTKHDGQKFLCRRCLTRVTSLEVGDKHSKICKSMTDIKTRLVLPQPGSKVTFKNIHRQFKQPYVIYADFESLILKYQGPQNFPANTFATQVHEVCSFAYICVRADGIHSSPYIYRGPNASQEFLKHMNHIYQCCLKQLQNPVSMIFSEENRLSFESATHCSICSKIIDKSEVKVRDHCHLTGKYNGAAHQKCNLDYAVKHFRLPIFIHNLRNYDSHLIMQAVTNEYTRIQCIAETDEKYKTFTINKLKFYDSFQHLSCSLASLAKNLPDSPITNKYFHDPSLIRKGIYPYEYMNSWDVFEEIELPPKEYFYSSLTKAHVSDSDYQHAQHVWESFECKTLGDYHDIYLKSDVCLLADVFEKYRETSLCHYSIDPTHYISSPGMSWDAFLKFSQVEIDLISDREMISMVESGIRGGTSMAAHNYCRANNKHLQDYDPAQPSNYIMYLDANNLYGWAMSEPLPLSNFELRTADLSILPLLLSHPRDHNIGVIVEVDLEYPHHLHDLHNDYPLAPERIKGTDGQLKLIPNLFNKTHYVCHYRILQFYVRHGLRVTAVHKILAFKQQSILAGYINKNTELRKKAKSSFEKDFFKLMNNACFGKTMENPHKRKDVRLVTTPQQAIKLTSKPQYLGYKEFHDSLYGVTMKTTRVTLDKPMFIGMAVLDLSKLLMFEFYYDYFKPKYPEAKLLYTDTDSLIINVPTEDIYEDLKSELEYYDTSDYPNTHPLFSNTNQKKIGVMKDEMNGKLISEYVGLRSKQYSIKHETGTSSRAKGIQKCAIKNQEIRHENYIEALNGEEVMRYPNTTIKSRGHVLETVVTNKKTLSANDTKRVMVTKEFAYALGHYKLEEANRVL